VVPFAAGNYNTIIYKVLAGEYEPLSSRLSGLPPDLERVVARAMALQPEARFATADELAAALEPFAYGAAIGASHTPMPGPMAFAAAGTPMPSQAPTTQRPPARRSRRWLLITVGCLALAGAAAATAVLASQGSDTSAAPVASTPEPPAKPTQAAQPAQEDAKVIIRVEPEPADAVITADGEPLSGGELVRAKSDATVEIAVSRDGYQPKTRTVSLAESRTVEVILEKTAAPARPEPPARKTSQSKKKKKPDGTEEKSDRIIDDSPYD
jgi:hypothetical protein